MKNILQLFILLISIVGFSQTTQIGSQNFEQTLIDLGIDSDNTLNGEVLTADIAQVTHLDLSTSSNLPIEFLNGIEDFTALEVLNISGIGYWGGVFDVAPTLDLSELTNLEELYFTSAGDNYTNELLILLLSNNPNLKKLESLDVAKLDAIDLKGSDLSTTNLIINLIGDGNNPGCCSSICLNVTNPTDAMNGQGVYSNWNVSYNNNIGAVINYSDDCDLGLGINNFVSLFNVNIFPNPVKTTFQIKTEQDFQHISIFSLQGKLIKNFSRQEIYDISDLPSGMYFVKIKNDSGVSTKKIVKL